VAYEGINNNLQNLYEFNLSTEERELLLADYKITALYERGEYDEALELYNLTFKAFADYILDYPESTKLFIKWQKDILLAK